MTGREIQIYKRTEKAQSQNRQEKKGIVIDRADAIYAIFVFLLSRAKLLWQLTPFGVSFFTASFSKKRLVFGIVSLLFGAVTAGVGLHTIRYIIAIGLVALFKMTVDRENTHSRYWSVALAGVGNFIGSLLVMLFDAFYIYDVMLGFVESIFISLVTILFSNVYAIEKGEYEKLKIVNREDMFGIVILLGLAVYGLTDFMDFGMINVCEIAWSLLIMSFAYVGAVTGGLGAGVMIGLVSAMAQNDPLSVIGLYSVCGLGAGFAQRGGKIGVAAIFLLTAVGFGVSTTVFAFGQAGILNMLIAAFVFALLPRAFYEKHFAFEGDFFTPFQQKAYAKRMNTLLTEKFQSLSNVFLGMSETVQQLSGIKTKTFSLDYDKVIDTAVKSECAQCSMNVYCWEKEKEKTLGSFAKIVPRLKNKGYVDVLDFSDGFKQECIRINELVLCINRAFATDRLNAVWDNQLNETRTLLGEQYKGFAGVMQNISKDITQKVDCESTYKNKIKVGVEAMGCSVLEVYLYTREDENYDVELQLQAFDEQFSVSAIEKAVSAGMQRTMRVSVIDEYNNSVRLEPQYNFTVTSSIATVKKDGETQNGDNYAVFNMKDNRCVLILSDGMGSGNDANKESSSAVELLKKLLLVGFDISSAVRLVNSALVLKAGRESFATIDMAVIDLFKGTAEFVKIGAARGYIKQAKGVEIIKCSSLPIGILSETDIHKETRKLQNGDSIILLSDGIADLKAAGKTLSNYIDSLPSGSTEVIAKKLLNYALTNRNGKADDDMTVIVAKIVENQRTEFV